MSDIATSGPLKELATQKPSSLHCNGLHEHDVAISWFGLCTVEPATDPRPFDVVLNAPFIVRFMTPQVCPGSLTFYALDKHGTAMPYKTFEFAANQSFLSCRVPASVRRGSKRMKPFRSTGVIYEAQVTLTLATGEIFHEAIKIGHSSVGPITKVHQAAKPSSQPEPTREQALQRAAKSFVRDVAQWRASKTELLAAVSSAYDSRSISDVDPLSIMLDGSISLSEPAIFEDFDERLRLLLDGDEQRTSVWLWQG